MYMPVTAEFSFPVAAESGWTSTGQKFIETPLERVKHPSQSRWSQIQPAERSSSEFLIPFNSAQPNTPVMQVMLAHLCGISSWHQPTQVASTSLLSSWKVDPDYVGNIALAIHRMRLFHRAFGHTWEIFNSHKSRSSRMVRLTSCVPYSTLSAVSRNRARSASHAAPSIGFSSSISWLSCFRLSDATHADERPSIRIMDTRQTRMQNQYSGKKSCILCIMAVVHFPFELSYVRARNSGRRCRKGDLLSHLCIRHTRMS